MPDRRRAAGTRQRVRPIGALINPVFEHTYLLSRKPLPFGRHGLVRMGGSDALEQRTFRALAGNHRWLSRLAAVHRHRTIIKAEIRFLFLVAMAIVTAPRENGLNIARKIDWSGRRCRSRPTRGPQHGGNHANS